MISVRIAVEPTESGYAVRLGPDVLSTFCTEAEAVSEASRCAQSVRSGGGAATLVIRPAAATESGPKDEAGFPVDLSSGA